MKKLGNDKLDVEALLDDADRNQDGVIQYEGTSRYNVMTSQRVTISDDVSAQFWQYIFEKT